LQKNPVRYDKRVGGFRIDRAKLEPEPVRNEEETIEYITTN
jgi:hypothetical protein